LRSGGFGWGERKNECGCWRMKKPLMPWDGWSVKRLVWEWTVEMKGS
jgi:hypothetical protein